jgi:hypothetical protein
VNSHNLNTEYFIKLGDVFLETFTSQLNPVFTRVFLHDYYIIKINPEYQNEVMDNLIVSPQSLPMVCPPLP